MTKYNPVSTLDFTISQEHILKIEQGNKLVNKELLLSSYKAHNKYIHDLKELNRSYISATKKTYFGLIFLVLLQLVLLLKVLKHNKYLERNSLP